MAEKTEQPTQKKLREARRRGEVPRSRELGTAAVLLAAAAVLTATGGHLLSGLVGVFDLSLSAVVAGSTASPTAVLEAAAALGVDALFPLLVTVVAAGSLAAFLQVGPLLTAEPVTPKLERLDPVRGMGRLFSQRRLIELLKAVLALLIVGTVAWLTLREGLRGVLGLVARDAEAAITGTAGLVGRLLLRVGAAVAVVALLDVFYQRWRHRQDQKMTAEEVKRERRESEGDPHARQQRQRMHREIAAHGVLEEVRRADVLVVNPTRLAVALRYDEEGEADAPEVTARGQEELARRMIRAAEEAGVPVMRDIPLARALWELEVGDAIPEALYEAVAAVLRAAWAERGPEAR